MAFSGVKTLWRAQAGAHLSVYGCYHKSSGMHFSAASAKFSFMQIKPQAARFISYKEQKKTGQSTDVSSILATWKG